MRSTFWDDIFLLRKLYDQSLEPVCKKYKLTRMELDILLFLGNHPSFDTATEIVERRKLAKSHVSISIKALERRHYLERIYLDGNRKTAHLRLLPPAREAVGEGQTAQRDFFAAVFRSFTKEEQAAFENALDRIAQNVRGVCEQD